MAKLPASQCSDYVHSSRCFYPCESTRGSIEKFCTARSSFFPACVRPLQSCFRLCTFPHRPRVGGSNYPGDALISVCLSIDNFRKAYENRISAGLTFMVLEISCGLKPRSLASICFACSRALCRLDENDPIRRSFRAM